MMSWYSASRSMGSVQLEVAAGVFQRLDERVDLRRGRVEVRRHARRGLHAEALVRRLRAVVTGTHCDAAGVQDLRDVVRVHALELEGDGAAALGRVERTH